MNKTKTPSGYSTSIEINGHEFDCIVDYTFIPASRGSIGDYGVPVEPDENPYIEFDAVYIKDGDWQKIDIPEIALEHYSDEILESLV